jgi:hypothetical protein
VGESGRHINKFLRTARVILLLTTTNDSTCEISYRDTHPAAAYVDSDYVSNSRVGFIEDALTATTFGTYLADGPYKPCSLKIRQSL